MTPVVDVHAHLVPPGLLEAVRAGRVGEVSLEGDAGAPVLDAGGDRLGPIGAGLLALDRRLTWMDGAGIDEQWVAPWLDLLTWHDMDDPRGWVAVVNAALAEVVAAHPRLRPVYAVHLGPGADPAADIATLPGRAAAVLVNTHPPGVTSLGDRAIEALWEALATGGIPALVHPPTNGPSCSSTPPVLQNITGRLVDTSTAVLEVVLGGVLDRHPDLDLLVVHGGGLLPYQAFRLDGLERAGLLERTGTSTRVSEALRRLWYDTVALDPASIELLVRRVGPDRVLLGSDAPFAIGDPDPVGTLGGCDLPPATVQAICGGNARRLGRLTAGPGDGAVG